jgi:hypothetical protein
MTACGRIAVRVSGGSSFETEAVASQPSSQPSNNARSSTTARLDRLCACHPSFDQSYFYIVIMYAIHGSRDSVFVCGPVLNGVTLAQLH